MDVSGVHAKIQPIKETLMGKVEEATVMKTVMAAAAQGPRPQ
jgi:hypothetical protein